MEAAVKEAAEQTWQTIAWDVLKAKEDPLGRRTLVENNEPTASMDRSEVIDVVLDSIRVHGGMTKEVSDFFDHLSFEKKVLLLGEQFKEDHYSY